MNIDRHNYEEFFILYLDNELSASDRQLVEDFAEANPDLKAELELLMQSKLIPETDITFDGKVNLLKFEDTALTEETTSMLLYIDNEMTPAQKKDFEQWIASNPAAQKELGAFQQARLQAEQVVFPHKHSLYRQEERRVVAIRWWRMAAAAVLLLGISTAAFMFNQERIIRNSLASNNGNSTKQDSAHGIAQANTKDNGKNTFTVQTDHSATGTNTDHGNETPSSSSAGINTGKDEADHRNGPKSERPAEKIVGTDNIHEKTETNGSASVADATEQTTHVVTKRQDLSNSLETTFAVNNNDLQADPSLTINKEINPLPSVTQEDDQPLDIMNEPGKKNRLRGFFRKITRTFEKTTNIKATDGEDRLLVGGLAIKF